MEVSVRRDDAALTDLSGEWLTLWRKDPAASVFQTPQYARAAWETEIGADQTLAVIEMRRNGELAGVATASVDVDGTLRFLGNKEVTDYLGPVCEPSDKDAVADAFVSGMSELDWSRAELFGLAVDTGWPEALGRAAKAAGHTLEEIPQDVCPRIAPLGTYDEYLSSLDGKLRHEIRRKARRLEREAGAYTIRVSNPSTLDADLETFYEMHRSSTGPKGRFMHEDVAVLFTRIARAFEQEGWLRLTWLEHEETALAGMFSFAAKNVWSVYNSAYDHTKGDLAPGMVLMAETIRLATEEGCGVFDMLRGAEPYKYRFGAVDIPLVELGVTRG
ncbi:MAG TPA: GNAT family N-acetyltransferase [Actinomycetota bacterium]|nr:GNAT family N-acetyltransferase [Actinomycetota bacterium]